MCSILFGRPKEAPQKDVPRNAKTKAKSFTYDRSEVGEGTWHPIGHHIGQERSKECCSKVDNGPFDRPHRHELAQISKKFPTKYGRGEELDGCVGAYRVVVWSMAEIPSEWIPNKKEWTAPSHRWEDFFIVYLLFTLSRFSPSNKRTTTPNLRTLRPFPSVPI